MPDLRAVIVAILAIAAVLALTTYRQHHPRIAPPRRYDRCTWCQPEDHAGPYCSRRGQAAQVVPQPRDGHSGHTVELKTLFVRSHSKDH